MSGFRHDGGILVGIPQNLRPSEEAGLVGIVAAAQNGNSFPCGSLEASKLIQPVVVVPPIMLTLSARIAQFPITDHEHYRKRTQFQH